MVDGFVGTVETERLNDSLWVLKLVGEHDLSTAPAVAGAFRRIADSCTNVVVDLTDTSFIDSTVVGALIGYADDGETVLLWRRQAGRQGGCSTWSERRLTCGRSTRGTRRCERCFRAPTLTNFTTGASRRFVNDEYGHTVSDGHDAA